MRVLVSQEQVRRILHWTQMALFAAAGSLLGYCGFVLLDAGIFQESGRRQLEQLTMAPQAAPTAPPVTGALIGRIDIGRLDVSVMVVAGISDATLRRAAGHIPGTSMPGQPGNIGISAHRDTFFRPLRNIRKDDLITLTTPAGAYAYRVVSTRVVSPDDVGVLSPGATEVLTLITCYPFYFVGPAPERFIVRAERVT